MTDKKKSISIDGVVYPCSGEYQNLQHYGILNHPVLSRQKYETEKQWLDRLKEDYGLVETGE